MRFHIHRRIIIQEKVCRVYDRGDDGVGSKSENATNCNIMIGNGRVPQMQMRFFYIVSILKVFAIFVCAFCINMILSR